MDYDIAQNQLRRERKSFAGLGQGPGYKKTKGLIWVTSITMIIVLTILAGVKIFIP
jgi:hypothetical protein